MDLATLGEGAGGQAHPSERPLWPCQSYPEEGETRLGYELLHVQSDVSLGNSRNLPFLLQ